MATIIIVNNKFYKYDNKSKLLGEPLIYYVLQSSAFNIKHICTLKTCHEALNKQKCMLK